MVGSAGRGGDVSVAWNSYFVGLTNTVIAKIAVSKFYCISFTAFLSILYWHIDLT